MRLSDEEAKKQLLSLPLSNQDKVFLWLVLAGEKPAAAVSVIPCLFCDDDKTVKPRTRDVLRFIKFLDTFGLNYRIRKTTVPGVYSRKIKGGNKDVEVTIFGKIFFVSFKKRFADKLHECFTDSEGLNMKNNLIIGKLLGYPEEAVEEFSKVTDFSKQKIPITLSTLKETHQILRGRYWEAYLGYVVRRGHELRDSRTAKRWADVIRRDLPRLAARYEKQMKGVFRKLART